IDVTVISLKLKYAGAAFAFVLFAMLVVTGVLVWQHDVGAQRLGTAAEKTARADVAAELQARAHTTAEHAAELVAGALRARDATAVARRLQEVLEDNTVTS